MNLSSREQIVRVLHDKEYRDLYVSENIDNGIAFQIRATRESRGWTQKDLGDRVGMAQTRICTLEDPDYGSYTLATLKKLASAFDVALVVKFVPYSQLVDAVDNISDSDLVVSSFSDDTAIRTKPERGRHGDGAAPQHGSAQSAS